MKGIKVFLKKKNKKHQDARKGYRNLSEEEKEKKHQYGREQYNNLLDDENDEIFLECKK